MKVRQASRWLLAGALVVGGAAEAQQASAPTATGETGLFTLIDGWTLPAGEFSLGFYYNNWDRIVAGVPGGVAAPRTDDWDYDWHRLSASFGYGVTDRLELTVMAPYEDLSSSDVRHSGLVNGHRFDDDLSADGLGNVRLGAKIRLYGDPETGEAISFNAFVEAPTGEDEGVTTDDTGFGAGLNWNFSPRWVARIGYRDPGDPDGGYDVSEEVQAGIGYATAINDRFDWITEVNATLYQSGTTDPDDAIDVATGGRYWIGEDKRWAFNFALRTEINQLSDTEEHCPIGGLVGLTMFPRLKSAEQIAAERLAAEEAAAAARAEEERRAAEAAAAARAAEEAAARQAAEEAAARAAAEEAARRAAEEAKPRETTETIHFPAASDRPSNIAKAKLDEVALRMKQDPAATAIIIGHTDDQGSEAANQALGLARAEAAKRYLVSRHQIDGSRISTESRGEGEPAAPNDTPEGREQNRRAVIIVRI
jgi:OOP family OmpA-OmpF porin